eukprot:18275-Heterococcus_DN1.PRE.1
MAMRCGSADISLTTTLLKLNFFVMATFQEHDLAAAINPIRDAGILQHVFTFLPGNWLFLGAVCSEWRAAYEGTADQQVRNIRMWDSGWFVTCGPKTTCYSAAVASPATARLASSCGLELRENFDLELIAGLHADMKTLTALRELGLGLSDTLVCAVAQSGCLSTLQQLLSEQQCPRPDYLSEYAASNGSISMLDWLRTQSWCVFDHCTCAGAVYGRQLAALQHLRSEGCEWDAEHVHNIAASSGNIELVEWLRQQEGIEIGANTLAAAAGSGHIALCEHLRSTGCGWDASACARAGVFGQLDALRWLRSNGCPWDVSTVCTSAACGGYTDILDYVIEQGEVLSVELLTDALSCAGYNDQLRAAQWLRQRGANWPAVLAYGNLEYERLWSNELVAWARAEGCTSAVVE